MSEPQIVPPTPAIRQGEDPANIQTGPEGASDAQTTKNVLDIFDKVMPAMGAEKPKPPLPTPPQPEPAPVADPTHPAPPEPAPTPVPEPAPASKVPSFIEEQLRGTTAPPPEMPQAPLEEVFPEQLPEFKTPEERTSAYKKWRGEYNRLKEENKKLGERPAQDPAQVDRLKYLETENKGLTERLSQLGVEQNSEFQRSVLQPMHNAWQAAARIVKEAGGDPQDLAKALNLQGNDQYEALDEIYSGMPESAKLDIQQHVNAYRHFAQQRAFALKDAPKTQAELKKRELERNYAFIENQKKEMGVLFDTAVSKLRDEAKLEVLQRSNDPNDQWWNEQGDNSLALSRELYLENTDMGKMAMACVLAPFADVYRKLWYSAMQRADKAEKILSDKFGSEPTISESSGNQAVPGAMPTLQEDLKKPFGDVFLREFHRQRAAGVR